MGAEIERLIEGLEDKIEELYHKIKQKERDGKEEKDQKFKELVQVAS